VRGRKRTERLPLSKDLEDDVGHGGEIDEGCAGEQEEKVEVV
jgi:hypothetical protein